MFIIIIKPANDPAYAQAFESEHTARLHPGKVLTRIDSPADVESYLTQHDFGGPIKVYGSVERIAREIGWIEPDTAADPQPRPQLTLPLCG